MEDIVIVLQKDLDSLKKEKGSIEQEIMQMDNTRANLIMELARINGSIRYVDGLKQRLEKAKNEEQKQ